MTPDRFQLEPTSDAHVTLGVAVDFPGLRERIAATVAPDATDSLPLVAESRRSRVVRLEVEGQRLVLKRYAEPGVFLLRTFLRASRARREAAALELISQAVPGNPVRPVAWAERRRLGLVRHNWLVTTELTESVSLRCLKRLDGAERDAVRSAVLEVLPVQVAALHRAGVFARNLHAKNVLVQPATGQLGFIDLPRARAVGAVSRRQRVYDLACLTKGLRRSLSAEDLRGFFTRYVAAAGLDLAPADLQEAVARRADVLDNRTPLTGALHGLRKWLRRTWLGQLVIGYRYGAPARAPEDELEDEPEEDPAHDPARDPVRGGAT